MKLWFRFLSCITVASLPFMAQADYQPTVPSQKSNEFSLGIEGFRDIYREPSVDVTDTSDYGSVTGNWTHTWPMLNEDKFLIGFDGRYSQGESDYKSASGTVSGMKQQEFDARVITGVRFGSAENGTWTPYVGLGMRYFIDNGKGYHTNLGAFGYDRRIRQSYVPIGLTYDYNSPKGWSITPNIEFDPVMEGNVNSRLTNGGGFYTLGGNTYPAYNIDNRQEHNGYGLRGEVMVGWDMWNMKFKTGPFVRYWHFDDSNIAIDPNGNGFVEPENTRLQYGLALKAAW